MTPPLPAATAGVTETADDNADTEKWFCPLLKFVALAATGIVPDDDRMRASTVSDSAARDFNQKP